MSIELVTGQAGSAHIDSSDVGRLLAGVAGGGVYLLSETPTVTMESANSCIIGPCDLLIQGRHVTLTGLTIADIVNGPQTGQRRDLICLRYTRAPDTGNEGISLVVIQGEPAEDTATDPALEHVGNIMAGDQVVDIPIVRVTLDALTPTAEWLVLARSLPIFFYAIKPDESAVPSKPSLVAVADGSVYLVS